jgi:hypothetical protein
VFAVLVKCPACKKVQEIPERRKVHCFWCGKPLKASQLQCAEPEQRPKVRLEKAPRVNLRKELPAKPKSLPPESPGYTVQCEKIPQKQRLPRYVKDAAFLAAVFPCRMLSTVLLQASSLTLNTVGMLLLGAALMAFPFSIFLLADLHREFREPLDAFFSEKPRWFLLAGAVLSVAMLCVLICLMVTAFRLGSRAGEALLLLLQAVGVM